MPVVQMFPPRQSDDNGGNQPPGPPDMDARISKLEALTEKTGERLHSIDIRLTKIETKMDQFSTKEDMHKEFGSLTWKLIGVIVFAQLIPAIPGVLKALHLIT